MSNLGIKNFLPLLVLAAVTGCGESRLVLDKWHGDQPNSGAPASTAAAGAPIAGGSVVAPGATPAPGTVAAPLTLAFAPGTVLPTRLRAPALVVKFVTNDASATFQCQTQIAPQPVVCPDGASYNFGNLIHSRSYSLIVHAHTADGRTSPPLTVSFVADLLAGMAPSLPGAPSVDEPVGTGPHVPQTPASLADDGVRLLQVGTNYMVSAQSGAVVTGYSTDKTSNGLIHSMRLLGPSASSVYPGKACQFSYERIVTIADGSDYCDGTPNDDQWAKDYGQPMPKNFVEVVIPTATGAQTANEKLMVAAYDAEPDASEANMGLGSLCQGASLGDTNLLQMLTVLNVGSVLSGSWTWCQVRDSQAVLWWIGSTEINLTSAPNGPRLRLSYSAVASNGVFTSPAYLEKTVARINAWVLPIVN